MFEYIYIYVHIYIHICFYNINIKIHIVIYLFIYLGRRYIAHVYMTKVARRCFEGVYVLRKSSKG